MNNLKIEMLSTGDEVLYGQIIDTNAAWLSDLFFQEGLLMTSRFTVGDNLGQLVQAIRLRSEANDILIINGGLGPTSDDLSAEAAALANEEPLILNHEWLDEMESYFAKKGQTVSSTNRKQAMLPQSAVVIPNPIGTACGFRMIINGCTLFFTPGVPSEFKVMVSNQIIPYIKNHYANISKPLCYRLTTMGRSESRLANEIQSALTIPEGLSVGYRSAMPILELKLTGNMRLKTEMDKIWLKLKKLVSENTLYEGVLTSAEKSGLAKLVANQLHDNHQSIIIVEQKTAGMIAYQLFEMNAPIVKSEVITQQIVSVQMYLDDLRMRSGATIALALLACHDHKDKWLLYLITQKQQIALTIQYTGRHYSDTIERQIFTAVALDAVRRYLSNLPLVGSNEWLSVSEPAKVDKY